MRIIIMAAVLLLTTSNANAQINNPKTETVTVLGDCGMCKETIDKAGSKKKLYKTDWNEDSKLAVITYDSKKTSLDAVLKNIALSGYDNANYLAPDETYNKLPGCCKYPRKGKQQSVAKIPAKTVEMDNHMGHSKEKMTNDKPQTSPLQIIFDNYFSLKDELVRSDGKAAAEKASALLVSLEAIDMGKLQPAEHDVWMKVESNLKTDTRFIKENKDIEKQRSQFMSLSKNMGEQVRASKPGGTIYYQFCPMADNNKGAYWLSKEASIKNPYYGSQMLSCGKTVETIKQ